MGSRMGPNYACLFVGYVVHHKKETSTTLGQPHARGRNSKPLLTSFLTSTSSITETELPFLDINLCISEDRIQTSVFYKETNTHKYLHFSCFHPDHCMRAICTAPEMIPTPKWSPTLKWSPNRPRNDPNPEMIPTFLLVDPEMIPKELGNGD